MVGIFKRELVISHRNKVLFGVAMKKKYDLEMCV